jgi:hypothetical protein
MINDSSTNQNSNPKKNARSGGRQQGHSNVENHPPFGGDEATAGRMKFSIDFFLVKGKLHGIITDERTGKQDDFADLDQEKIIRFMLPAVSSVVKSATQESVEEPPQPIHEIDEQQKKEVKETRPTEMQTRRFSVIPKGTTFATRVLRQEQPLELKWSFESPSISGIEEGEKIGYKVIISRMNLPGGPLGVFGETKTKAEMAFRKTFDIHIPSESLPAGTYRLEGQANFWRTKSKKPEWRSLCKESCLIVVT